MRLIYNHKLLGGILDDKHLVERSSDPNAEYLVEMVPINDGRRRKHNVLFEVVKFHHVRDTAKSTPNWVMMKVIF